MTPKNHTQNDSIFRRLNSYEREVVGPFLPQLPEFALRQIVDTIDEYRNQVFDSMIFADTVTRAAVLAINEAKDSNRDVDWAERYVSRAVADATIRILDDLPQ